MGAFTSRAGLYKPGGGSTGLILPDETVDIDKLNGNFNKIDALLGARNIPSASSYSGNMDGDLIYAQDTKFLQMYSAADSKLITPKLPGSNAYKGTKAQRDLFTDATEGDSWLLTDDDKMLYVRRAAAWVLPAAILKYAEFSFNRSSIGDGLINLFTTAVDAARSTDTVFATVAGATGQKVKIIDPGIYAVSFSGDLGGTTSGRSIIGLTSGSGSRARAAYALGDTLAAVSLPAFRVAANEEITFEVFKTTGGGTHNFTGRVNVFKLASL